MRGAALLLAAALSLPAAAAGLWFDDFDAAEVSALRERGWVLRDKPGHPGVPGATWGERALQLVDDPARPGNRLLRLLARTDGTPQGTLQAQLCHQRKALRGTYAARMRFSDRPAMGADGDPVVMAFYAVSPLRHDFDPDFSEVDFEYLPNGGWGSDRTRLYAISWQTARIDPWQAHNQARETFADLDGWHELVIQVEAARVRHFLDGRLVGEAAGRNVPAVPMAVSFNLWFSPAGLLPRSDEPRSYEMDIDWVLHIQDRVLSPAQVRQQVQRLRRQKVSHTDSVPATDLASDCRF